MVVIINQPITRFFALLRPPSLRPIILLSNNRFNWGSLDMSLNYQLGFKSNKERLLTFSYKYSNGNNPQRNELNFINRQHCTDPTGSADVLLQGRSGQYYYMSFSGSKELIKDKLTISASVNYPFMKYRYYETLTEGLILRSGTGAKTITGLLMPV